MSAGAGNETTVVDHIHYWWAGLLMFWSRCETKRIVWRGYRQWIGRQKCQNELERIRESSASTT